MFLTLLSIIILIGITAVFTMCLISVIKSEGWRSLLLLIALVFIVVVPMTLSMKYLGEKYVAVDNNECECSQCKCKTNLTQEEK